jgi:hypothetical protein
MNSRDYDSRYREYDEDQVFRMMRGDWRSGQPDPPGFADRLEAVRRMAAAGLSDTQMGERIGRSPRQVLRLRVRWGIRGLPLGTNGATRPVMPVVWARTPDGVTVRREPAGNS